MYTLFWLTGYVTVHFDGNVSSEEGWDAATVKVTMEQLTNQTSAEPVGESFCPLLFKALWESSKNVSATGKKPLVAALWSPFIAKVPFKSDETVATATSTLAISSAAAITYRPAVPSFYSGFLFYFFSPQQSLAASVATGRTLIGSAVQRVVEDAWRSLGDE